MKPEKEIIVGGQAVIEGVMMRAPNSYAVSVRRLDGSIVTRAERLPRLDEKYPFLRIPVLRGGIVLIHSMLLGIKALNFSATVAFEDQENEEAKNEATPKNAKDAKEAKGAKEAIEPAIEAAALTGALVTTAHSVEAAALEPPRHLLPDAGRESNGAKARASNDSAARTSNESSAQSSNGSGAQASNGNGAQAEKKGKEKSGGASATATAAGSITFALFFNVLLFIVLPLLLTNAIFIYFGWSNAPQLDLDRAAVAAEPWYREAWSWLQAYMKPVRPSVAFNLVDGVIRMAFFILMIFSFSRMRDIKRVFEYHGAEHKTVYAWEAGDELTVANARRYPRQHPRCGTSFLMIVMLVSIVLFSLIKFDSLILNLLIRIALIPVIAGISYEIIRAAGRKETSAFFSFITRPGIWLQNLTTREPSDDQLEVAIHALKESLKLEPVRDLEPVPLS